MYFHVFLVSNLKKHGILLFLNPIDLFLCFRSAKAKFVLETGQVKELALLDAGFEQKATTFFPSTKEAFTYPQFCELRKPIAFCFSPLVCSLIEKEKYHREGGNRKRRRKKNSLCWPIPQGKKENRLRFHQNQRRI